MKLILLFLFCLYLVHVYGSEPALLSLTLFSDAKERNLVCNDGTPAGFYWRVSDPDRYIIHFQGGGWCYDETSCSQRMEIDPNLMSSAGWPTEWTPIGLFDQNPIANPYWSNASYAYIPYCSSDSFSGNRSASNETFGWNFFGKNIITEVIQILVQSGLDQTNEILLSGCSAGGAAVVANVDYVASLLPELEGRIYKGHADAGWFVDAVPYVSSMVTIPKMIEVGTTLWGGIPNEACMDAYKPDYWKCYLGQYAIPFIETPVLFHQESEDFVQLLVMGIEDPFNTSAKIYYLDYFRDYITHTLLENPPTVKHGVFSPACYWHCSTEGDQFYTISINGTLNDEGALAKFFFGDVITSWIDHCDGFSCSNGCPPPPVLRLET